MVRGKGTAVKRILTEGEKSDIKGQIQEAHSTLKEMESYGKGTQADGIDKAQLQGKINHYEKVLQEGTAPKVRGNKKDDLQKRADYLASELKQGMPTRFEMDHPAKAPGAVHKHMNWDKRNKGNMKEYKNIMRTLEPNDPTSTDVEKFRKEK